VLNGIREVRTRLNARYVLENLVFRKVFAKILGEPPCWIFGVLAAVTYENPRSAGHCEGRPFRPRRCVTDASWTGFVSSEGRFHGVGPTLCYAITLPLGSDEISHLLAHVRSLGPFNPPCIDKLFDAGIQFRGVLIFTPVVKHLTLK
jgi:hypothetical protein